MQTPMQPPKKPKSRQEILKQQHTSTFVGREEHLTAFRYNLTLPPLDWCFLFSVWGQGGVGKSTLLRQFQAIAEQSGCLTALTNDSETNVLETMVRLANQLQGKLPTFSAAYQTYCKHLHDLEADPHAPQGIKAYLRRTAARTGIELSGQIPIVGMPIKVLLDEDVIINRVSACASYIVKKVSNQAERQLVQSPIATLTPLFLKDLGCLAGQTNLLLLFDTYECTSVWLDDWLREILEGHYGDLSINIILVVAGRDPLNQNLWAEYEQVVARIPIQSFTNEEINQYLACKNIINPQVIDVIVKLSGGLPLLVATLAAESPSDPSQVGNPSGTAVDRFLKWVDDPKRRQIALDAALPQFFNRDVIAVLHGEDSADELFNWLKQMPFVEERADGWMYHDIARTQMLRHKRLISPKGWAELHGKLAEYYAILQANLQLDAKKQWYVPIWQNFSLHILYHQLCQSPHQDLSVAWNEFVFAISRQISNIFSQQWADVMEQAGRHTESAALQFFGRHLSEGLKADEDKQYDMAVQQFTKLLAQPGIQAQWKPVVLLLRGLSNFSGDYNEMALEDMNEAIRLDPACAWAHANRGIVHRWMNRDNEALRDLDRAIELDPDNAETISRRGVTYGMMGQYENALRDLDKAIELEPNNPGVFSRRGTTYGRMGLLENALKDISHAVELDPTAPWIVHNLGFVYHLLGRYEDALVAYDQVIAAEPDAFSAIWHRGNVHLKLTHFHAALEDFNRAVELKQDNGSCFGDRALAYFALNQPEQAKDDLSRAIHLLQRSYDENSEEHRNIFKLAFYYLIANNIEQSKQFYRDALSKNAPVPSIRAAIQDLEDLLRFFPEHPLAKSVREALLKRVESQPSPPA